MGRVRPYQQSSEKKTKGQREANTQTGMVVWAKISRESKNKIGSKQTLRLLVIRHFDFL